jgi:hypothetical protein
MRIAPLLASVLLAASLASTAPAFAAATAAGQAPPPRRDAREQAPASLIGGWKADMTASRYGANPPKAAYRFFEYTAEGKVLVTFMTLAANGNQSTGHWAVQLDGAPGIEYTRAYGSVPYNVVGLKKVDDQTFDLTVSRHGAVSITGQFKLSPDGQTLTYSYTYAGGGEPTVVVYRRWDMGG